VVLPNTFAQEVPPTAQSEEEVATTPEPEATPALSIEIGENLSYAAASFDLSNLKPIDLLRMVVAIGVIVLFLLTGRRIVTNRFNRVAKRTPTTFDDQLIERIQGQIRWLVVILGVDIGALILFFKNETVRDVFSNLLFWFNYGIFFSAAYTTIRFFFQWYENQLDEEQGRIAVFLPILQRFTMVLLIIFAAVILLDHVGINVTGLAAAAALIGLAVALAAQDIIGDLISGYVILMYRLFRVGDRIEIPDQDTWGDVVEIGIRTTRMRTRDNNLVIIPNSSIADGQVTNYTYPDPNYRL
jgi:small-conductance mechanosensitive channel